MQVCVWIFRYMAKMFNKTKDICNTSNQVTLGKAANHQNPGQTGSNYVTFSRKMTV